MGFSVQFGPIGFGTDDSADVAAQQAAADRAMEKYYKDQELLLARQQFNFSGGVRKDALDQYNNQGAHIRDMARQAGVGINSFLGGGNASPMSLTIPGGNFSGRVGGKYSGAPASKISASIDVLALKNMAEKVRQEELKSDQLELQNQALYDEWAIRRYQLSTGYGAEEDLYIPLIDNSEDLRLRYGDKVRLGLNPAINMEYPESIGGYYWFRENTGLGSKPDGQGSFNKLLGIP